MKSSNAIIASLILCLLLSSCEFQCKMGDDANKTKTTDPAPEKKNEGPLLYNGIELVADSIEIDKAYLLFDKGGRVPEGNLVDFTKPVHLVVKMKSGWTETDGKVWLGASEKITNEGGEVLLEEKDLFASMEGATPTDAKTIALMANITVRENSAPTSFTVAFRIWDKKGPGSITGHYKLYSK